MPCDASTIIRPLVEGRGKSCGGVISSWGGSASRITLIWLSLGALRDRTNLATINLEIVDSLGKILGKLSGLRSSLLRDAPSLGSLLIFVDLANSAGYTVST